jgi:hypothetical protein
MCVQALALYKVERIPQESPLGMGVTAKKGALYEGFIYSIVMFNFLQKNSKNEKNKGIYSNIL